MTFMKVKYIGTTGATFTNDKVYDCYAVGPGNAASVVGDNGTLQAIQPEGGAEWEIVSLQILEMKDLIP